MIVLGSVALICLTAIGGLALALRVYEDQRVAERCVIRDRDAHRYAIQCREITLKERMAVQAKQETPVPIASEPMPPDLVDYYRSWEDDFAQDDQRKVLMELYAEYRDWDLVRQRLPRREAIE